MRPSAISSRVRLYRSPCPAVRRPPSGAFGFYKALFLVSAIAVLAGCSHDLTGPVAPPAPVSDFSANVVGAVQAPLAGPATLITVPADTVGTTALPPDAVLGLMDKSGTVVAFQWYGLAAPAVGTYNVGFAGNDIAMSLDQSTGAPGSSFDGITGTVTITSSDSNFVSGTFYVAAAAQDTNAQITVVGRFTAQITVQRADSSR